MRQLRQRLLGTDQHMDLKAFNSFSPPIGKVSFKTSSISLGLVLLSEKLFVGMYVYADTAHSAIMSPE